MKKISLKIFIALLTSIIIFTTSASPIFAAVTCQWAPLQNSDPNLAGKPAFCMEGFTSEAELRSSSVRLGCSYNCGGALGQVFNRLTGQWGNDINFSTMQNLAVGHNQNGYYTCLTDPGGFDQSIKDAVNAKVNSTSIGCAAENIALLFTPGVGWVARVGLAAVGGNAICDTVEWAMGGLEAGIYGTVFDSSGNEVCTDEVSLSAEEANTNTVNDSFAEFAVCNQAGAESGLCLACLDKQGVWTALGCIPTTPEGLAQKLLPLLVGLAGAIAMLVSLFGILQLVLAGGDREQVANAKETITAALAGLIFIIISIVLLKFIGVDILNIPGF